jgi:uncharacterized protein YceH (UPF0502 family)
MRLPKTFDPVETRVLGALLEKEQATPEYYPLTVNALVAACNQKSNREPVMELDSSDVLDALNRLHVDVLVWQKTGGRAERWRHSLDRRWEFDEATKAIMTLLLLRGAQTPGELRGRSDRLHQFASTTEVENALQRLAEEPEPLVVQLPRRPGQKESRWMHLAAGTPEVESLEVASIPAIDSPARSRLVDRIEELEKRVTRIEGELGRLLDALE